MDKECYLNSGITPAAPSEPAMHSWNPLSLAQHLNSTSELTSPYSLNSNWDNENDHFTQFPSSLSSVTSFPAVPVPPVLSNGCGIHDLIAKLGPLCNPGVNLPPFSSGSGLALAPAVHVGNSGVDTPGFQIMNEFVKDSLPSSGGPLNSPLQAFSADPEFAERAAKFSCFGSRSFNSRRSHPSLSDAELPERSNAMARVWSSPSLKQVVSPMENKQFCQMELKKMNELPPLGPNSNESSSISEQAPSGETVSRVPNEIMASRKRKAAPKNKAKENVAAVAVNSHKVAETDDVKIGKRLKTAEGSPSEKGCIDREEEEEDDKDNVNADMQEHHKQDKANQKLPEPPKDYIHVRARRGQATDSHSLAERVRREKIGERMKLLQNLVPGCNKVTGKALMLDEIINYVQSLQRQVEFLSMKLASVDPREEVNMDNFASKDTMQQNGSLPRSLHPIDSSVPVFYDHQSKPCPPTSASVSQCPVDPVYKTSYQNLELQLPSLDAFIDGLPQFPVFGEDDLHSIVRMGLSQDAKQEPAFHSMSFPVRNQLHRSP